MWRRPNMSKAWRWQGLGSLESHVNTSVRACSSVCAQISNGSSQIASTRQSCTSAEQMCHTCCTSSAAESVKHQTLLVEVGRSLLHNSVQTPLTDMECFQMSYIVWRSGHLVSPTEVKLGDGLSCCDGWHTQTARISINTERRRTYSSTTSHRTGRDFDSL